MIKLNNITVDKQDESYVFCELIKNFCKKTNQDPHCLYKRLLKVDSK